MRRMGCTPFDYIVKQRKASWPLPALPNYFDKLPGASPKQKLYQYCKIVLQATIIGSPVWAHISTFHNLIIKHAMQT